MAFSDSGERFLMQVGPCERRGVRLAWSVRLIEVSAAVGSGGPESDGVEERMTSASLRACCARWQRKAKAVAEDRACSITPPPQSARCNQQTLCSEAQTRD